MPVVTALRVPTSLEGRYNQHATRGRAGKARTPFKDNCCTDMCTGSEAGSYLRLKDIVSLNSRLESNREEEEEDGRGRAAHQEIDHGRDTEWLQGSVSPTNQPSRQDQIDDFQMPDLPCGRLGFLVYVHLFD